ncbi:thiamine-phosphate kinase [Roseospira visakhapatnamensis]|uniref:Thiamine-monophosphate kinase n=1 Tax=Roseospira visakhapatnamensis TaxID=390880 RepID=A0A7W6RA93_9PROT|nr:thiamine-phosphate kinase [Roseospira visakhapatnamensis]MBB4264836.1 thiamine-monophosphate kinase [Roseospira visakhapatnamensis]
MTVARTEGTRRGEFDLINSLFAPLARRHPAALNLADDAAVLPPPEGGQHTVVSMDTLVSGVHFLPDDPADLVARKAMRVNLSDMAAMGARPLGVFLSVALSPAEGDAWMDRFTRGLEQDLGAFDVGLLGGDTVATPGPATFSITILGTVPPGTHLSRGGGRPGDHLWVSGTIGDSALGLRALQGDLAFLDEDARASLADRYRLPCPRVALGIGLRGLATAALDISDGLSADLAHLCRASGCAARVSGPAVPLSAPARDCVSADPTWLDVVLGGGDDYELVFAAPPGRDAAIRALGDRLNIPVTRVGALVPAAPEAPDTPLVWVLDGNGAPLTLAATGYRHRWE